MTITFHIINEQLQSKQQSFVDLGYVLYLQVLKTDYIHVHLDCNMLP